MKDILNIDTNGKVREKYLRYVLVEEMRKSTLNGYVPSNGAQLGVIEGKPEEYADYLIRQVQSSAKMNALFDKTVRSYSSAGKLIETRRLGLFSIDPKTVNVVKNTDLFQPRTNITHAIRLYEKYIHRTSKLPVISGVISI